MRTQGTVTPHAEATVSRSSLLFGSCVLRLTPGQLSSFKSLPPVDERPWPGWGCVLSRLGRSSGTVKDASVVLLVDIAGVVAHRLELLTHHPEADAGGVALPRQHAGQPAYGGVPVETG